MVSKELSEAAVEFNYIINHSSQEVINKIPKNFINYMKSIASTTYTFNYDESKKLNEQNLKKETRGLISLVYQDYICDKEERKKYIQKCKDYELNKEKELRDKYNPDNIFENKNIMSYKMEDNLSVINTDKKSLLKVIFEKIKSIINR